MKGGYFRRAVFLEGAAMGLGAHVREGSILEEQASGAHCVGLKQTILFPFVTLGSLINFCDCLMAGGTSRKNHSEVGSSYIHFNFTADGDKTTPSLFGDVPGGVMLNQPPIFLGGQGGSVGPLRLGYGNVTAAGTILRKDVLETGRIIIGKTHRGGEVPFVPGMYSGLKRIIENNILYLGNLMALEQWYMHVRKPFLESRELGNLIFQGALNNLFLAKNERKKRLMSMAEKLRHPPGETEGASSSPGRVEFFEKITELCQVFDPENISETGLNERDQLIEEIHKAGTGGNYIRVIQGLPPATVSTEPPGWNKSFRIFAERLRGCAFHGPFQETRRIAHGQIIRDRRNPGRSKPLSPGWTDCLRRRPGYYAISEKRRQKSTDHHRQRYTHHGRNAGTCPCIGDYVHGRRALPRGSTAHARE